MYLIPFFYCDTKFTDVLFIFNMLRVRHSFTVQCKTQTTDSGLLAFADSGEEVKRMEIEGKTEDFRPGPGCSNCGYIKHYPQDKLLSSE